MRSSNSQNRGFPISFSGPGLAYFKLGIRDLKQDRERFGIESMARGRMPKGLGITGLKKPTYIHTCIHIGDPQNNAS